MRELEARVTLGGFYYIHSIVRDTASQSLVFTFIRAPETGSQVQRVLTFSDIEEYREEIDVGSALEEAADGITDSLIGIIELPAYGTSAYEIVTEDQVYFIRTLVTPSIQDHV